MKVQLSSIFFPYSMVKETKNKYFLAGGIFHYTSSFYIFWWHWHESASFDFSARKNADNNNMATKNGLHLSTQWF